MKKLIFIIAFLGITAAVQAQDYGRMVYLRTESTANMTSHRGKRQIVVDNIEGYGTYAVNLHLRTNNRDEIRVFNVTYIGQKLMSFNPTSAGVSPGAHSFSYQYVVANIAVDKKVKTKFVYSLPILAGNSVAATTFKNSENGEYMGVCFEVNVGDTICAINDGIVVNIENNFVEIQHEDGTKAKYTIPSANINIHEGEEVEIGEPIAICSYNNDPLMILLEYYKSIKRVPINDNVKPEPFYTIHYLNPIFATFDGNIQLSDKLTMITAADPKAKKRR